MENLKKIYIKILLLLTFVLLVNVSAFTQVKKTVQPKKKIEEKKVVEVTKPVERPVIVALKEGEPLKGTFINASSEGVQILIAGNTLILKWNDISKLVFTDVISNEVIPKNDMQTKSNEAIEGALKSLRKLAAATEVGINFQEYGRRVIDVKTEVEEFLPKISESYLKNEIQLAMKDYVDAANYWNDHIKNNMSKYSSVDLLLSLYWKGARKHIENATKGEPEKETK